MAEQESIQIILNLIQNENQVSELRRVLEEYHPYDIAQAFLQMNEVHRKKVYLALDDQQMADIFEYCEKDTTVDYLGEMSIAKGASILNQMEVDDAIDVLNEMTEDGEVDAYLEQMSPEDQAELYYLSTHEKNTAGAMMTTNYIELESDWDVKEAMKVLIQKADDSEIIDPLFVCQNHNLVGILTLKDLILARSPKKIYEIMNENIIFADAAEDKMTAVQKIRDYDMFALPVLEHKQLVGIITMDDALDVMDDTIAEDYSKMAGVSSDIDEERGIFYNLWKRIPWLIGLLALSLLISNITSSFEGTIQSVTVLVFFQTMILDMAGNVGTQSLAVAVRGLSRHELDKTPQILKHLQKELRIVILNSLILGIVAFITCTVFMLLKGHNEHIVVWLVALIVACSMSITLIMTGLLGAVIPILFSKMKIDPAVASGPLITTLNDIIAIVIYFGLSSLLLQWIIR